MAKIEKFRPHLKPGKFTPQGEKLIFETEKPLDQIVLPIESVDFLLLCNGEHTVGEIIETLYHSKGIIQFKSIYKTLVYLKERGFLENGDELEIVEKAESHKYPQLLSFRPFFEIEIGKRFFSETERPGFFYAVSMLCILTAILSFQLVTPSWFKLGFLSMGGSYTTGLTFLFIASSILLSLKNMFKCLLLIFLTGRAYNFGFVFTGFAFYFRVKSDSLFLVSNRLYLLLFYLAVTLCYFPIVASVYFFLPNLPHLHETMSLGVLLFLLDLNPFQNSKAGHFFRRLFNDDTINRMSSYMKHRPFLSLIHPLERNRDHSLYFFFVHFALAWAFVGLYITYSAIGYHYTYFLTMLKTGSLSERVAALMACSFLITLFCVILFNAVKIFLISFLLPVFHSSLDHLRKRRSHRLEFFNNKEITSMLTNLPLFSYFNAELLDMIVNRSQLKEYKPGTPVIVQGGSDDHLYVLLSGALQVRRRLLSGRAQNVAEVLPISIFGEVAVIEDVRRTADVIATRNSIVLEVPARMLRQVAEESQYIRELDSFRNAIMVNQFFTSAPMFRELSETVVQLFISKGKIESFLPHQIIFKQGDQADGFYLLLRGSVGVMVNGRPVSHIQQGGFFGEISMIADVPRTATLYAVEQAQVLKVSRDAFWEILALDISMAMFIESVGEMRIREDIEVIRAGSARTA